MSACELGQRRNRGRQASKPYRLVVLVLLLALFAGVGCDRPSPAPGETGSQPPVEGSGIISYTGAASRLGGSDQDPAEATEQLRDWARTGLASLLGLSTAQLRDALYDTVPVRDPAFADLAEQPTGPGRSLFDGRGVLHILVPRDDPYEARTIGLLIDDYRADAGADPERVQTHHYQIDPENHTITIDAEQPAPTATVRAAHGYVELRVDQPDGLRNFLAKTQHLSLLERRGEGGSEIWAGGWRWPGVPGAQLSYEDVSVIQRGYRATSGLLPGFSLDAGPLETRDDLLAVVPDLSPDLADRLIAGQIPDGLAQMVDEALFHAVPPPAGSGLPSDRAQLWAISGLLQGQSAYRQARYDGPLEGTEVGMTLFYTDMVAKNWTSGVGTGIPTRAVGGFIPDLEAEIPWSHCPEPGDPLSESGRLWFGQNESGFTFDGARVSIGAQATRLFSRSGPEGAEVEPSYGFGRGLRWWDQHEQAVADYEPQYHRLDQIMRWSGALEWLVSQNGPVLPQLAGSEIRSDLQFQDWYASHDELRERSPVTFVRPPSATQEGIRHEPSATREQCGFLNISGGVSLGDLTSRKGGQSFRADLPPGVRRAGPVEETSAFNEATGTGSITQVSLGTTNNGQVVDSLRRIFSAAPDGHVIINATGSGRRVASLGRLKIDRADTATRDLTLDLAADGEQISQGVDLQGKPVGTLEARKDSADTVTIRWRPRLLDRARRALESFTSRQQTAGAGPPAPADGVLYGYEDPATGQVTYRIEGGDSEWLSISPGLSPPGEDLVLRSGAPPSGSNGGPRFFQGRPVPRPELMLGGGRRAEWMEVIPRTTPDGSAVSIPAVRPDPGAPTVRVDTPDRETATAYLVGERLRVRIDDPVLGLSGTVEGAALLRDFPNVQNAMRSAAQARDGLSRAIRLGDEGVAFAYADHVLLVATGHPWADRALLAIDPGRPERPPLFRIEDGQALHIDPSPPEPSSGPARHLDQGTLLDETDPPVELYALRSLLIFERGRIVREALPRERRVVVVEVVTTEDTGASQPPDVHVFQGRDWYRIPPPPGVGGSSGHGQPAGQPILLVAPECPAPEGEQTPTECAS